MSGPTAELNYASHRTGPAGVGKATRPNRKVSCNRQGPRLRRVALRPRLLLRSVESRLPATDCESSGNSFGATVELSGSPTSRQHALDPGSISFRSSIDHYDERRELHCGGDHERWHRRGFRSAPDHL